MNLRRIDLLIIAVLIAVTVGLYAQTARFQFINYDDSDYVTENAHVLTGLTTGNLKWAFTTGHAANWHPITWISHQLDAQFFGPKNSGAHHGTSVFIHVVNACLLYALIRRFTNHWWLAAIVAGLFAWHPLRVESVAWVSERKDVLAAFFWLAATHAYISHTRTPSAGRYILILLLLALGLMSKPMLVTFPFALLLLDFWPLKRLTLFAADESETTRALESRAIRALVIEKLPMIALVIASCIITFKVQNIAGAVAKQSSIPIVMRLENALVSVIAYLSQFVLPVNLSFFYPHPGVVTDGAIPMWKWIAALAAIAVISVFTVAQIRRRPYLFVGWFFYLGTLVPVIGIVQVGSQSMADRYTYIPMIGITLILGCAIAELLRHSPKLRPAIVTLLTMMVIPLIVLTYHRIGDWRDSETLMRSALKTDERNFTAHNNLAIVLDARGEKALAETHYKRAIEVNDRFAPAEFNLANLYAARGEEKLAFKHYKRAIQSDPRYVGAYIGYGNLLVKSDRPSGADDAILVYREGVKRCPDNALLKHNLAQSLAEKGDLKSAIPLWREAMALDPDYVKTPHLLGIALTMAGDLREGINLLRRAIELDPANADAMSKLAWILSTHQADQIRQPDEAVKLGSKAIELSKSPTATDFDILAAAQASAGRFDEARMTISKAIASAESSDESQLLAQLHARQLLYEKDTAYVAGSR